MELELTTFLIVCPLVFFAGLMDSIAGGGGIVALPAYILAGVPIHSALATNKLSSMLGTAVSTLRFWKHHYVNFLFILPSVVAALIGSLIGSNIALIIDEKILKSMLIIILPITAYFVFKIKSDDESEFNSFSRKKACIIAAVISFIVGGYDGFYGPGAGVFLIILYTAFSKMEIRTASGNAKLVNLSSNIAAFLVFLINGKVIFLLGLVAAIFSIAGHYIGAGLAIKNGLKIVKPTVLIVLAALFIKIISGN